MKRSEINKIISDADDFITQNKFYLPPFAYWTPEDWREKGADVSEIVKHQLGWDITDFGQGNYDKLGLFLFTLRNGNLEDLEKGKGKVYAEKIMIVGVDQVTPMHYHKSKTEDIINRGGGDLEIQLYNPTEDDNLAQSDVKIVINGIKYTVRAGDIVTLKPGESITLSPYCYHKFWGSKNKVLVGEVSSVNNDDIDNVFYKPIGRFPDIEEDESPLYLLVKDYYQYYQVDLDSN